MAGELPLVTRSAENCGRPEVSTEGQAVAVRRRNSRHTLKLDMAGKILTLMTVKAESSSESGTGVEGSRRYFLHHLCATRGLARDQSSRCRHADTGQGQPWQIHSCPQFPTMFSRAIIEAPVCT